MMNSRSSPLALAPNGQGGSQGSEGAGAGKEEGSSVPNGRVFGLGAAPGLPLFLGAALLLVLVVAAAKGLGARGVRRPGGVRGGGLGAALPIPLPSPQRRGAL